ncbi:hypothetical protein Kfla_6746 [Kribbella flavida DSM 17836]|uniref:PknH-like extracellular domain-containing protein n=1 Tax=Kribbella flavida (strain DSM 17836 / JCM 10339 / NBRC 14399) TaxID=479435 RepID=D2Q137_KRIFD|nr:hypothetical protein [Kribbella flavida]ADB35738.1 hypothetical protein Kfla_6746 [Kribbella flavida DSM 17836]
MTAGGWQHTRLAGAAGIATLALVLGACGNEQPGAGASTTPSGTPSSAPSETPSSTPVETPAPTPSVSDSASPSATPTKSPGRPVETPTPVKPARLTPAMLLPGAELAEADPKRNWAATNGSASTPICGRASTRGQGVLGSLNRNYANDLDASGGQWLTRYQDAQAATAAYDRIVKTIRSCTAARPAPTHAHKITEDRTLALGDATRIVRWYDYPLPSDPGSEAGGFPYAVTRRGAVVSVLAFREMGPGIKPANFERIARSAAAHLG